MIYLISIVLYNKINKNKLLIKNSKIKALQTVLKLIYKDQKILLYSLFLIKIKIRNNKTIYIL